MKKLLKMFLCAALTTALVGIGGCGPKPVSPYASQPHKNMPEGKSLNYGKGTITEETTPGEESLTAAGNTGQEGFGANSDHASDAYKREHGRSSPEMQPIYFDFDQAAIRDDQTGRLEHNAQYLNDHPSARVVIEGNCDERGTNEYNLALGERRAQNAKTYLIELGVDGSRIRTISYGEERPLFTGSDEDSWAQNRRDDFVLE